MKRLVLATFVSVGLVGAAQAGGLEDAKRGFAAAQKGAYEEALYFSSLAITSGELSAQSLAIAHNNRGFAYDQLGMPDRAIREYGAAVRVDPDFAVAYNNRGYAYNDIGLYSQAIADFSEAILLKPDYADAFNNRGIARAQLGDLPAAVEDYTKAIALKPNLYQAYNNRGYARFNLGEFEAAARDLDVIVRLAPNNLFTVIWHHLAVQRSGGDGRAALAKYTSDADLEAWPGALVELFLGKQSPEEVIAAAAHGDPMRQRERDCELHFYLGQYYLMHGDTDKAADQFRLSLETGLADFTEFAGAKAELDRLAPRQASAAPLSE